MIASTDTGYSLFLLMKEMGWTLQDIRKLDGVELGYFMECLNRYLRERKRAIQKARRRR